LTGAERRRAIARIREQVQKGHGCTNLEALLLLDYLEQTQEELTKQLRSDEWRDTLMDRRYRCWSSGGDAARAS